MGNITGKGNCQLGIDWEINLEIDWEKCMIAIHGDEWYNDYNVMMDDWY